MKSMKNKILYDKAYKNSLINLLEKLPSYFSKPDDNEAIKYINALDNLVHQNINKLEKATRKKLRESEREDYFIFVRNYLYEKGINSGKILKVWINTSYGDTKEKMAESNNVTFNFDKLKIALEQLKASKAKFTLKGYELEAPVAIYGSIAYTVIKGMLENDLTKTDKPLTTNRKLIDNIYHTLKNLYNHK